MMESRTPYRRMALARLSPWYSAVTAPGLFDDLECFCMFIGHGRSGSSLMGALLNAHPDVVMSNELNVVEYMKAGLSIRQLYNLVYYMSRRQVNRGSEGGGGYSYQVPNQWQGKHRRIQVIGDRKAGATAIQIYQDPQLASRLIQWIGLPLRFVHVVRNPFDTLATTVRKTERKKGETESSHLDRQIERYFSRASAVKTVLNEGGEDNVHFLYHEDLMIDAGTVLSDLCSFVGVVPDEAYIRDCIGILRKTPHITRNQITWTPEYVRAVSDLINDYPWLSRYTFCEEDGRQPL